MSKMRWFVKELDMEGDATLASISADRKKAVYDLADGGRIVLTGEKLKAEAGEPANSARARSRNSSSRMRTAARE